MNAPYSLDSALFWGDLVQQAYATYYAARSNLTPPLVGPPGIPPGWQLKYYLTVTDELLLWKTKSFFGYIISDGARYGIVMRGTETTAEWFDNVEFIQDDFVVAGRNYGAIEDGFYEVFQAINVLAPDGTPLGTLELWLGTLPPTTPVVVTGHSLGGAVATIAAAQTAIQGSLTQLYTFASPLVGDSHFVAAFNALPNLASYRIYNRHDLVPKVPPQELGFAHVDVGIAIDSTLDATIKTTIPCLHYMTTYLATMGSDNFPKVGAECTA
jgi:predicted lipase